MTSYKEQWIDEATGENSRPHISIVMNFTKPTKDKPALLTFGELETFLHEFGHSLHGMFANSTYENLSGYKCILGLCGTPLSIHGELRY